MKHLKFRILVPTTLLVLIAAGLMFAAPTAKAEDPTPNPQCQFVQGDIDQDGIPDGIDETPAGPDNDGNGVPDLVEPCVEDPSQAVVESEETVCRPEDGDADADGLGDICDPAPNNADADGDTFPDSTEIRIGTDPVAATSWPFDMDNNGRVDIADLLQFNWGLGKRSIDVGFNRRLDINVDGRVDAADLLLYRKVLGKSTPGSGVATTSSGYYATATSTWSHSCSHSYTGKSWTGLTVYKLGLTESYWGYMNQYGIAGFSDPPYYWARTYAPGWSYHDLTGDAYRIGSDPKANIQAYTHAGFKYEPYKFVVISDVTRWVWVNVYGNQGFSTCGKYSR